MFGIGYPLVWPPHYGRLCMLILFFFLIVKPGQEWGGFYFVAFFQFFLEKLHTIIALGSILFLIVLEVYTLPEHKRLPHYLLFNCIGLMGLISSLILFGTERTVLFVHNPVENLVSSLVIFTFACCLMDFLFIKISIAMFCQSVFVAETIKKEAGVAMNKETDES